MMETLSITGLLLLAIFLFILLDFWILRRFPCKCGRRRWPYFEVIHERVWWMCFWPAIMVPGTVSAFMNLHYFTAVMLSLLFTYHVRRVWFHEKDRLKRKAAKLAGKVGFNTHGRLVVESVSLRRATLVAQERTQP